MRKTMATHREQRRCREEMPHFGRGAGSASSHKWLHVDAQLALQKIPGVEIAGTLPNCGTCWHISPKVHDWLIAFENLQTASSWAPTHWAGPWLPTRPGKQPHLEAASAASVGFFPQQTHNLMQQMSRRMVGSTSSKKQKLLWNVDSTYHWPVKPPPAVAP